MSIMNLKVTNELKHLSSSQTLKNYSADEKQKLAQASKQFESLLTSMMIKSMNQTTEGMFGENSFGGDFFDSIFQFELASKMSEGQGMGIANQIFKNITGEELSKELLNLKIRPKELSPKIELNNKEPEIPSAKPSNSAISRLSKYEDLIDEASAKFGVNRDLIKSVILAESAAKENALSSANAKGLMQIIDPTAEILGIKNVWDPKENIMGGTKYLAQLLRQYNGDIKLALAGYNAGPARVEEFNGIPPYKETKNYINRVLAYLKNFEEKSYARKQLNTIDG
ncbi:MAG: transglycosylase SLT domain-containing protein [Ignavibacteriaceae bacterium]|nr:transglycosylase SLT domain-containing protein [Ignavibacteriaceae bacterium]